MTGQAEQSAARAEPESAEEAAHRSSTDFIVRQAIASLHSAAYAALASGAQAHAFGQNEHDRSVEQAVLIIQQEAEADLRKWLPTEGVAVTREVMEVREFYDP